MFNFNFPKIHCIGVLDQSMKVIEEANEAEVEAHRYVFYKNNREKLIDELLDVIQACETFLRYICQDDKELQRCYERNINKNRSRKYFSKE